MPPPATWPTISKIFWTSPALVLVPVLPSTIDLEATVPFLDSLAASARVKKGKLPVALVGNRLKPWTGASQQAMEQIKAWPYPVVAELRDTQAYVLDGGVGQVPVRLPFRTGAQSSGRLGPVVQMD